MLITHQRNAPPRMKRILHSTDIRLIVGSATFEEEYHRDSTVVSTSHYRAPDHYLWAISTHQLTTAPFFFVP
jgi:hypothetical protein